MIFKHGKASNDFSGLIGSTLSDKLGFVQESGKNGGSASLLRLWKARQLSAITWHREGVPPTGRRFTRAGLVPKIFPQPKSPNK